MEDVQVAPSATEAAAPEVHEFTSEQRAHWLKTGDAPEAKSAQAEAGAEAASAEDKSESSETDESRSAPEAEETEEQQEKPKKGKLNAEQRIAQLESTIDKIRRNAGLARKADGEAAPERGPERVMYTRPEPKFDDVDAKTGKPKYGSYEEFTKELGRWSAEQLLAEQRAAETAERQRAELDQKLEAARSRYEDLDSVIGPTAGAIHGDQNIPLAVKVLIDGSPVVADLLYVLGEDPEELSKFIQLAKRDPAQAVRQLVRTESLVMEELNGGGAGAEAGGNERDPRTGQFKAPQKQTTKAPPPEKRVNGRGAAPADEAQAALEAGDFRRYQAIENRKDLARRRGQGA